MNSQIAIEMPKDIDVETVGEGPRNYTVFVRAFEHVVMGGEKPLHHHAMTQEEYERFVNDMWIGIVLTLVVVFIVFALCFWYMYHKFQLWKRHYDARSRLRSNGSGLSATDLEILPNYSLVSGLPTYDDAIEQLRLSNSKRINKHQTIMKFFESVNDKIDRNETPLPTYDDTIVKKSSTELTATTSPLSLSRPQSPVPYGDDWTPNVFDCKDVTYSVLPNIHGSFLPIAAVQSARQNRFKCILIPESNIVALEENSGACCSSIHSHSSLPLRSSLGSLNIVNEIKNSKSNMLVHPWVHGSAMSLRLDYDKMPKNWKEPEKYEHRASLH